MAFKSLLKKRMSLGGGAPDENGETPDAVFASLPLLYTIAQKILTRTFKQELFNNHFQVTNFLGC